MNNNLISIIVPVYNVSEYLPRCLDSLINQTYKNIEIILVNDGSTDNSLEICKKYAEKDLRIKVIDKENGGISSARNTGIAEASGEWIGFVDSDDYIEPCTYEIALNTALEKNTKLVQWNLNISRESKEVAILHPIPEGFVDLTDNNTLIWIFSTVYTKLIHKDLLNLIKPAFINGLSMAEDVCFSYRLFNEAGKFYYIEKALYHYYIRKNSTMHTLTEELIDNTARELRKLDNELKNCKKQSLINSMKFRKIEVKRYYITRLTVPNSQKFRQTFKEFNPYFLTQGESYLASILGLDWVVKAIRLVSIKIHK